MEEKEDELADLEKRHREVEAERDEMQHSLQEAIDSMRNESELQVNMLEQKLKGVASDIDEISFQSSEIMRAAGLDEEEMERVLAALSNTLEDRDDLITPLQYELTREIKS